MKKFLTTALAAIAVLAAVSACKPVLPEYQKIAEEDYYAKLTINVKVVTTIESTETGFKCNVEITRASEPGKTYTFTTDRNGNLSHTFPLGKPAKKDDPLADTFSFNVDYESDSEMIGHQVGTLANKTLTIKESDIQKGIRSAENDEPWKISCSKK